MANDILDLITKCNWEPTRFLFTSGNVFDPLIYYSHLFPLISSLALVIFLYIKSNKTLATKLLLLTTVILDIWLLGDLILWATNKPYLTMYVWTILILVEPMIYAGLFYFLYLFIEKKDISFTKKLIITLLLTPTVFLASTKISLIGYDLSNCDRDAIEGPLVYYGYLIEIIFIIWILVFSMKKLIETKNNNERLKIFMITVGSIGFLVAFAFGNVIGSFFDNSYIFGDYSWTVGQYGIFGIPIFMAFLSYVIVRYKTFNIKIFGTQMLVGGLVVLIGSQYFFIQTTINKILTGVTLLLTTISGIFLIRSVKREIEQREKIEKLAKDLVNANDKLKELDQLKSEFLSLATHQIRAPLTAIKGYASMILDGDFGPTSEKVSQPVNIIFKSCQNLINIVSDFLNISRIEQGRMTYEKSNFDLVELVQEVVKEFAPNIESANLKLEKNIPSNLFIRVNADRSKIKQVIGNIIDNAIKYTKQGGITVSIENEDKRVKVKVKDTGVGIDQTSIKNLFEKFYRIAGSSKISVNGTGLGLYIAKKMIEAHNGDIKIFSDGVGKGSEFVIELPKN